jgi:hypothetical protein
MVAMRLWEGCFVSGGTVNNFTNDLCANLLKATPQANSPSPEFALEIAPLIHSGRTVWFNSASQALGA